MAQHSHGSRRGIFISYRVLMLLSGLFVQINIYRSYSNRKTTSGGNNATGTSIDWFSSLLGNFEYLSLLENSYEDLLKSAPGGILPKDPYDWRTVDLNPFELLYARLTRVLFYSQHLPFQGSQGKVGRKSLTPRPQSLSKELKSIYLPAGLEEKNVPSVDRRFMHVWTRKQAERMHIRKHQQISCLETGDAHFLKTHFRLMCSKITGMDLFDKRADVKMDLTNVIECDIGKCEGFDMRTPKFAINFNSFNLIVSHQVFEHIPEPQKAMTSLAKLLAPGGTLLWSAPFLTKNHGMPYDFQLFTRSQVICFQVLFKGNYSAHTGNSPIRTSRTF